MEITVKRATVGGVLGSYALPIAAFVSAVVAAVLVRFGKDHTSPALGVTVVTALVTLLSAVAQHFRERDLDKKSAQLEYYAKENLDKALEMQKVQTGGDSFALAYFPFFEDKYWLALKHFGAYPLGDLRLDVVAFHVTGQMPEPKLVDRFVYPSLPPSANEVVKPINFGPGPVALQISFRAANGWWAQTVKAVWLEGRLRFAYKTWHHVQKDGVVLVVDGVVIAEDLYEEVDPLYPREPDGTVDWSFGAMSIGEADPRQDDDWTATV
jgi:hypothetical protein